MKINERNEFRTKPSPLIGKPEDSVLSAVQQMNDKNFGSVVVVDAEGKIAGMVTERDIFRRLVAAQKDPATTPLSEIMTTDVRAAREDDELIDWLRVMSNERFRRLPIVDHEGKLKAIMSQGDFVSYTWPELMFQATRLARSSLKDGYYPALIAGGIALYTLLLVVFLRFVP